MIESVTPSAMATEPVGSPTPGGKLGKEEFLKMLVAQLQNQNPLNPMEGKEMAAQLAQFSSLEQLTDVRQAVEQVNQVLGNQLMPSLHASMAMEVLGRTVTVATDRFDFSTGEPPALSVDVAGMGGNATLKVFDQHGNEIGSRSLGTLTGGRHDVELGEVANGLPPGSYSYAVQVVDASGNKVATQPLVQSRVEGIRYGPNGPILTSGGQSFPLGAILEIGAP